MVWAGGHRATLIGVGALISVAAGGYVGLDAAGHVDASYRTPSGPRYEPPPSQTAPLADSSWPTYPIAAAPMPANWEPDPSLDDPVRYAPEPQDAWADEPPPVRVHRASARVEIAEPPAPRSTDEVSDVPADDVDGWVDPPDASDAQ